MPAYLYAGGIAQPGVLMTSARRSQKKLARRARLLIVPAAAVIAVTAISLIVPGRASATTGGRAAQASKSPPAAVKPPPLTLQDIVQNLGATTYQDAYGGMTVSPTTQETGVPGHITIDVVAAAPDAAQFLSAIRTAAATPGASQTSYSVVDVPHSFAQLYALTLKMAQQRSTWRSRGISLEMWGPDPSSGKVAITLDSYTSAAAQSLYSSYGKSWTSVSAKSSNTTFPLGRQARAPQAGVDQGRFQDSTPFYGGDFINNPGEGAACTDGFVMIGAVHPDNHWLMTAGHCGSQSPWYTNLGAMYTLGGTSTNYFQNFGGSTKYDVQTIGLQGGFKAWGNVWGNDFTTYQPYTTLTAGAGQLITFDGAITGEVHDIKVDTAGPVCLGSGDQEVCGVGVAGSVTGPRICQDADSGGPVFQRTSTPGPVKAIGLITSSNNTFNVCIYTLLNAIMGPTNTRLDTNPAG
jgi:hypothetical protein